MLSTTLRFSDPNEKNVVNAKVKQQRVIPVGQLLYTDSNSLPFTLSSNSLLFTTDTRELYIGTGTGLKRVNLGNDGEIIDKTDYLTKEEAAQFYVQKEYLDPKTVMTQERLDEYLGTINNSIQDLMDESDLKADLEDVYTKLEANQQFIDNQEFDTMLAKKVDQEVLTNTGNHSFIQNFSTGVTLKFQNIGNDTESYINVGKDRIYLYVKHTNGEMFGGRLFVTPDGAFYTHTNDEDCGKNDEILTYRDFASVQDLVNGQQEALADIRQIAMRSAESARQSELMIEQANDRVNATIDQATFAVETAQSALSVVSQIQKQLGDMYTNAQSAVQQAEEAVDTAEAAKTESDDTLTYLHRFEASVVTQLNQMLKDINDLKSGDITPGPTEDKYKIVSVQAFDDIYEVPYHTEAKDLNLPTMIDVGLDSPLVSGDVTHENIGVTWLTDRFQAHQTNYSQQIIGVPTESARIINPNYLFAIYTIKVLEEESVVNPDPYEWSVIFAVPKMVDTIENFSTIIGHPEILSSDLMGDLDSRGNYVKPTCELYLLGTLNEISSANKCFILTDNEQQSKLNRSILDITENGFKVPILGVDDEETIAKYETTTLTQAFVLSNGAYQYTEGTLIFDHGVDANNVYLIRMKN